jgi:hypothetical protein
VFIDESPLVAVNAYLSAAAPATMTSHSPRRVPLSKCQATEVFGSRTDARRSCVVVSVDEQRVLVGLAPRKSKTDEARLLLPLPIP